MYKQDQGSTETADVQKPSTAVPDSVLNSVRLLYAAAAATVIYLIVDLTMGISKSLVKQQYPHLSPSQANNFMKAEFAITVVVGLLMLFLWIYLGRAITQGKSWARTTGSVLFGFCTVGLLLDLSKPGVPAVRIVGTLIWLIALGATVLLWRPTSSAFFKSAA